MFLRYCTVFYCLAAIISADVGDDFDSDYYGIKALGSNNELMDCNSDVFKYFCSLKCGENHACLFGKCLCLEPDNTNITDDFAEENPSEDFKELREDDLADYSLRPVLRHHIAHFCPNLEKARACIRKCMQLGKPAFCGKDHVCYCGHNNGNPSKHVPNPEDSYNQFQDLYEKYFGHRGRSD